MKTCSHSKNYKCFNYDGHQCCYSGYCDYQMPKNSRGWDINPIVEKQEEEFISDGYQIDMYLLNKNDLKNNEFIFNLFDKYIGLREVKIKCKDGCIQIERINNE